MAEFNLTPAQKRAIRQARKNLDGIVYVKTPTANAMIARGFATYVRRVGSRYGLLTSIRLTDEGWEVSVD